MRKTFALLFTLTLAASCAEQEVFAPVEPTTPNSDAQIVPGLSIGASVSSEVTPQYNPAPGMANTHSATRATTTYPYVIANAAGKKTIVVTKDMNGVAPKDIHPRWQQTPYNTPSTVIDGVNIFSSLSPCFEVAQTTTGPVEWGTTNANCTAPWRRPTVAELEYTYKVHTQLELEEPFNTVYPGAVYYAAATEKDANNGYHVHYNDGAAAYTKKSDKLLVRCVRDAYPYVTTNADGKASVIVSRDEYGTSGAALHTPWKQSPYHVDTDPRNSVSYRFEVAQEDDYTESEAWTSENGRCVAPWRRPTEKELKLVWDMGQFLDITPLQYVKAGTYWASTTQAGTDKCVGIREDGTSGAWNKNSPGTAKSSTRCVRDLFDNFPDAAGSKVATMWGYTATTGLLVDNLVPPIAIKNTTAGFELETPKYYPVDGNKKLYFYAHAPHDGGTISNTNNATVTYTLDGQKDVMWAKDERGIAKNTIPAQQEQPYFLFQHKLMRIMFKVVADTSYPASQTVTKITVKGSNTKVVLTVPTGATTFSTPGDIVIEPKSSNTITTAGTTLTDLMMIAPNSTVTLVVEAGGVTYPEVTLNLTGQGAGTAGVNHLVVLTFKQNKIVPTAVIIPWENGEGGDGDLI